MVAKWGANKIERIKEHFEMGVDIVTFPYSFVLKSIEHPLTEQGLQHRLKKADICFIFGLQNFWEWVKRTLNIPAGIKRIQS